MFAQNDTSQSYGAGWGAPDGVVSFNGHPDRADRAMRKIIDAIFSVDNAAELDRILDVHSFELDAMLLDFPENLAAVTDAADEVKAMLATTGPTSGAPVTAQSTTSQKMEKAKMFATNQTEGSKGPWMTWSSNGSAAKGFPPKSWVMRGKDEHDQRFEQPFDGFARPCVFDLDTLKLGWEKDGAQGQAPERVYSSHYSVAMPRPDESKKSNGAFQWTNALQVRIATSQTEAFTWEQGSFGAYQAFAKLAALIEAQWAEHSQNGALLPVVQQTGVEQRALSSGTTNIPILSIVKWAPRPAILKDNAPTIATQAPAQAAAAPAQAAAAPAQAAAPAAPAAGVPADAGF